MGAHPPFAFSYGQSGQGGQPREPTFEAAEAVTVSNATAVLSKTNHAFFIAPPFDRQSEACSGLESQEDSWAWTLQPTARCTIDIPC